MRAEGCFQFFYASPEPMLPHPDVPTRDVMGTCTEPYLELMMENWCPCRERFVTPRVRRALELAAREESHFMILTTRHPTNSFALAVGILEFSRRDYEESLRKFPDRWSESSYLPYVGSRKSKLVSFTDAFNLKEWMSAQNKKSIPGGQGGIIDAPADLLDQIRVHFASKTDKTKEFLENVCWLESQLTGLPDRS